LINGKDQMTHRFLLRDLVWAHPGKSGKVLA